MGLDTTVARDPATTMYRLIGWAHSRAFFELMIDPPEPLHAALYQLLGVLGAHVWSGAAMRKEVRVELRKALLRRVRAEGGT